MRNWLIVGVWFLALGAFNASHAQVPTDRAASSRIHVRLDALSATTVSGRLLVFAIDAKTAEANALETSKGKSRVVVAVDANPFRATQTSVAAREVSHWVPLQTVSLDADEQAFPKGFSHLPAGDYYVQAVLDVNHSYNYTGRGDGDLVSDVVKLRLPLARTPTLRLKNALPKRDPWELPAGAPVHVQESNKAARTQANSVEFISPALSAFWGRPTAVRAWVLTPPNYQSELGTRYPTVYFTHGFGSDMNGLVGPLRRVTEFMADGQMPPMVWVFLDQSSPTGTHEFADSVNNGPWGQALTTEFIPYLESQYRMDGKASGRFLQGHSSGGWATLWLQTQYPSLFGGTWSTSPDSSDFHDFSGIDLYAPNANVYRKADGSAFPLVRDQGKVLGTYEQFARLEHVLGSYGGQLASFDWVFSPRAKDGAPMPMFNRDTGVVDPLVVAYWRENYDIAHRVQIQWPRHKTDLDGKVHVVVGTADTFYLNGAAVRLKTVLDRLGAKSDFQFLEGRSHFDVYAEGKDRQALLKRIAWSMYARARPDSPLRSPAMPVDPAVAIPKP